jgi:hypothetical protein
MAELLGLPRVPRLQESDKGIVAGPWTDEAREAFDECYREDLEMWNDKTN